ncbi:sugar kinase [Chloroflexi bacterium]|nr:sugar kinase [Chloroflexota bacterium]
MPDLISIGECMIELFSEEPMESSEVFQRSLAGDTFNVLVAAGRMGTSTGYITLLGDDPFQTYLQTCFEKEKIDISQVKIIPGFNAAHFVATNPDGDREFIYYRTDSAPTHLTPDHIDENYLLSAKILHCSGIAQAISESSRNTVLEAARKAHENKKMVSYDPNYRHQLWDFETAREAMKELMPFVDIFMPSIPADSQALFGTNDTNQVIKEAINMGVEIVVVTKGHMGSSIYASGEKFDLDPYQTRKVIDTTGAGDAFNGAFLHGIMNGMSNYAAACLANVSAGLNITSRGALGGMAEGSVIYDLHKKYMEQMA